MKIVTKIKALEREANSIGFSMSKVCKSAGIARTTLWRSERGEIQDNQESTYDRLRAGLKNLVGQRCSELSDWLRRNP